MNPSLTLLFLSNPHSLRLDTERKQLTDKHAAELAALPEDDEEARADLLNRHQQVGGVEKDLCSKCVSLLDIQPKGQLFSVSWILNSVQNISLFFRS